MNQREEDKKIVNDIDYRWEMIGKLVEKYGNDYDELAWAMCRGDAAEWKLGYKICGLKEEVGCDL